MPACHAGDRRFESGRVRHHSAFPYAPSARPDGAFFCPGPGVGHTRRPSRARSRPIRPTSVTLRPVKGRPFPVVLGLLLVALVTVLAVGQLGLVGGSSSATHGAVGRASAAEPPRHLAPAAPSSVPGPTATPRRVAVDRARPPRAPGPIADVPIVPVTNFRAAPTSTTPAELEDVLAGTSTRYTALELVAGEADAILAALKVERPIGRDPPRPRRRRGVPRRRPHARTASGSPSCAPTRSGPRSGRWPGATRRCSASSASRPSRTGR